MFEREVILEKEEKPEDVQACDDDIPVSSAACPFVVDSCW